MLGVELVLVVEAAGEDGGVMVMVMVMMVFCFLLFALLWLWTLDFAGWIGYFRRVASWSWRLFCFGF